MRHLDHQGRRSIGAQGAGRRTRSDGVVRPKVIDVWASNFDKEADIMRNVVEKYPYIAMDVRLPGVVARPTGRSGEGHGDTTHFQRLFEP